MTHKIGEPRWVLVNETLHTISDFAHLPPGQRPAVLCPVCRESVLLKLGRVRTHHYAHNPGATCAATQPETALHLNTKFYLATKLKYACELRIAIPCQNRCGALSRRPWLKDWDTVEVEYRTDSYRPDIALLRQGTVIGAIEVVVTHPVHEEKKVYFEHNGISWIEVAGDATLYDGTPPWEVEAPLTIIEGRGSPERWTCAECRAAAEAAAQRAAREAQEAERQEAAYAQFRAAEKAKYENRQEIHAGKMIDFYFPSGKKYREVYYVVRQYKNGEIAFFFIKTEKGEMIARVAAPLTEEAKKALSERFRLYLRNRIQQRRPSVVDEYTDWQLWVQGNKFFAADTQRFPFHYYWNAGQQQWINERDYQ